MRCNQVPIDLSLRTVFTPVRYKQQTRVPGRRPPSFAAGQEPAVYANRHLIAHAHGIGTLFQSARLGKTASSSRLCREFSELFGIESASTTSDVIPGYIALCMYNWSCLNRGDKKPRLLTSSYLTLRTLETTIRLMIKGPTPRIRSK